MKQFNLDPWFRLGSALQALRDVKDGASRISLIVVLGDAVDVLEGLLSDRITPVLPSMRLAAPAAYQLWQELRACYPSGSTHDEFMAGWNEPITGEDAKRVNAAKASLENALRYEMSGLPLFYVSDVLSHDKQILIYEAHRAFPASVQSRLAARQAIRDDVDAAGRSLAFNLPTATGFHILRAFDSLLREIAEHVAGPLPQGEQPSLGPYIVHLEKKWFAGATREERRKSPGKWPAEQVKLIELLLHLKDNYRNVVTHDSAAVLDEEEAQCLFDFCRDAMRAMLHLLPEPPDEPMLIPVAAAPAPIPPDTPPPVVS